MRDEKNKRKGVGGGVAAAAGVVAVGVGAVVSWKKKIKKFCSSDWSAEREPSSIMYMMDP